MRASRPQDINIRTEKKDKKVKS
ncbi:MAG: hypothetical protein OSP8Acid_10530 [uncultured Acidilobus sp. OSP8]|nr:MAG: hypothetical protein OSP8Acid_10530 [uncultured Acidilobus sp. OSP8]